jgi:hypothetical protein
MKNVSYCASLFYARIIIVDKTVRLDFRGMVVVGFHFVVGPLASSLLLRSSL